MNLSTRDRDALGRVFGLLAEAPDEREMRAALGRALLDLLHADYFASYVWDAGQGCFDHGVSIDMAPANLARYEAWYQYRDPITLALQARRRATFVHQVMPYAALRRTEFFNDFLARDGLHWGVNLHAFDGSQALGDLRIWRSRRRDDFTLRDKELLDFIEPAFTAALRRSSGCGAQGALAADRPGPVPVSVSVSVSVSLSVDGLSPRELQVARAVATGLTDKQIAQQLGIGLATVRTYLRRVGDKTGQRRRAGLAAWAARR